MRAEITAALLAVTVTAACGGDPSAKWEGSITDSAGIAVVRNPATGIWGPGDSWTLNEALRIGSAEGEPEYQFGMLLAAGSIGIASDGRIVVFDAQGQHIKVFTPDGQYERTIGRAGNGPGEIGPGQQSQMLIAPGDTVFLSDMANQRVSLFLLDGTFVRSFPLSLAAGIPIRWENTEDGRILAQVRPFPGPTPAPDSMDAITVRLLDGTVGDTLMQVPSGKTFSMTGGLPEWNFFVPEPLWTLWGTKILYAVNDNYHIGVYNQGTLERVIEKPFTLDPVTDADQQPMKASLKKLLATQGAPPQLISQLVDTRMHFAPNYPVFAQMLAGPFGTILVQSVVPISKLSDEERENFDFLSGSMGSREWDVFDDQGRYLGQVTMPLRFQPVKFVGDEIYGIQRDELDVQYVVKLTIETAAT
jgi:hypothetical protein